MLAERVKAFKVGPGFDEGVSVTFPCSPPVGELMSRTHGPLIHMRQADKVDEVRPGKVGS
jgi:hypothetical protein